MKKTSLWLSVVVGLQVLWMVGMAITTETKLSGTTTVLLETLPVDPRDLLRGDYVILNYKISSVPAAWLQNAAPLESLNGRPAFVTLEKRGEFWEAVAASLTPVEPRTDQYVVRGTLESSAFGPRQTMRVHYGIEKYFVPEGTGNPTGKLTVECVVTPEHDLLIKQVFLDGRPYAEIMGARENSLR